MKRKNDRIYTGIEAKLVTRELFFDDNLKNTNKRFPVDIKGIPKENSSFLNDLITLFVILFTYYTESLVDLYLCKLNDKRSYFILVYRCYLLFLTTACILYL